MKKLYCERDEQCFLIHIKHVCSAQYVICYCPRDHTKTYDGPWLQTTALQYTLCISAV